MSLLKKITNRLLSRYIESLKRQWGEDIINQRRAYENTLPKFELQEQHIEKIELLLNRTILLEKLPKDAVCAEIGVDKGDFTKEILQVTAPKKLHLVDAWGDKSRYHDGLMAFVKDRFKLETEAGKVELNIGLSTDVLVTFPDNYFDWVYIDTAHTYEVTASELDILINKVKKGGIIAGHDFVKGNWATAFRYGVIEAVHEFCVKENWELLYLTCEVDQHRSFAIRAL